MIRFIINNIKKDENYHGQFSYIKELNSQELESSEFPENIDPRVKKNLYSQGIKKLYTHQREAIEVLKSGKNVIIATSTATGKTLSFNIPVISETIRNPSSTSLFIYPTKALTLDQYEKFELIARDIEIKFGIYDGDTPQNERIYLRRNANILFSNPDILHVGILPNHINWSKFFSNLKFVLIDEAHYYSGVLGSHFSEIMRRLRRVANYYGSHPQFIISSATLQNPGEFSFKLIGERFDLVSSMNGIPNKKYFIIFNPELIQKELNLRKSIYKEAIWVIRKLFRSNLKVITFVKSRQGVELVTKMLNQALEPEERLFVSSYRAGYTKEIRHEIEKKLKDNELKIIITTNALELGIDIGDLDASVIVGYPGSLSSLFQQSGRSGRKKESLTIFIASSDILDQYFVKNPDFFFSNNFDSIEINSENPYIFLPHLKCAAYELPLDPEIENDYFGNQVNERIPQLEKEGALEKKTRKYFYTDRISPAPQVNIRGSGEENVRLIEEDTEKVIERISWKRAIEETFEGAVYLHLAKTYIVKKLDLDNRFAVLSQKETEYYTDSLAIESTEVIKELKKKKFNDFEIHFGDVLTTEIVRGYVRKQFITDRKLGVEPLDLPKITFYTKAFWFTIEDRYIRKLKEKNEDLQGSIHALEHLLIGMMGLVVVCDRKDIGGVSHPIHPDTEKPTIFIYDGIEGGVGISEKGFEKIEELFSASYKNISNCPCKEGCPSCIYSPKCGNENKPLSKNGAYILLKEFLA